MFLYVPCFSIYTHTFHIFYIFTMITYLLFHIFQYWKFKKTCSGIAKGQLPYHDYYIYIYIYIYMLDRTSFSGMHKVVLSKPPFRDQPYMVLMCSIKGSPTRKLPGVLVILGPAPIFSWSRPFSNLLFVVPFWVQAERRLMLTLGESITS